MKKVKKIIARVTAVVVFSACLFTEYDTNYAGEFQRMDKAYYKADEMRYNDLAIDSSFKKWKNAYYTMADDSGRLAVFNSQGKRITEYEFKGSSTETDLYRFVYGTGICSNEKKEYGIMTPAGQMLVPYGRYSKITRAGALYKATYTTGESVILNMYGEETYKPADNEKVYGLSDVLCVVENQESGEIKLFNNNGDIICIAEYVNSDYDRNIAVYLDHIYVFTYGNRSYLIDAFSDGIVGEFEGVYKIKKAVESEGSECILLSNARRGIFITDGKVIEDESDIDDCKFENDMLTISKNGLVSVYSKNGEAILEGIKGVYIYSKNTYAVQRTEEPFVEIYNNGNITATISKYTLDKNTSFTSNNVFAVRSDRDKKIYMYDFSGKQINENGYDTVDIVNNNNCKTCIVSEHKDIYKLVNIYGRTVSDEYYRVEELTETNDAVYFIGSSTNGVMTLIDCEGNIIFKGDGMKVIENYDGETCITILNCNGKYEIYNIEDHEYIIDDADSVVNCDCGYITATFFGKRKYYTYKGMQINGLE